MEILRGHSQLTRRLRKPVVAIGNFDGVHLGHVHIFEQQRALARASDGEAVVLTFDPHPAKVLAPTFAPPLITTLERKLELLERAGLDAVVIEPFDAALAARTPSEFIDDVLASGLGAKRVCVGLDFTFGRARSGTVQTLTELGGTRGFSVTVVPPFTSGGIVCSSTKVREFVLEGRVDGAALLLGRDPDIEGEVLRGDGRGQSIGFPTANLRVATELVPKGGVYAGWAEVTTGNARGTRRMAAINVGTLPTFGPDRPLTVEAHLLDYAGDLYGATLRLGFHQRLRTEERFATVEALVAQIGRDVEQTRRVMSQREATR